LFARSERDWLLIRWDTVAGSSILAAKAIDFSGRDAVVIVARDAVVNMIIERKESELRARSNTIRKARRESQKKQFRDQWRSICPMPLEKCKEERIRFYMKPGGYVQLFDGFIPLWKAS